MTCFLLVIGVCRVGVVSRAGAGQSRVPGDSGGGVARSFGWSCWSRVRGRPGCWWSGFVRGDIELGEMWFCEGPPARRPVLEPTPTPERASLTAVRQEQISGSAGTPGLKGPAYVKSSDVDVAGRPASWKVVDCPQLSPQLSRLSCPRLSGRLSPNHHWVPGGGVNVLHSCSVNEPLSPGWGVEGDWRARMKSAHS